jgi:hypothetical protein
MRNKSSSHEIYSLLLNKRMSRYGVNLTTPSDLIHRENLCTKQAYYMRMQKVILASLYQFSANGLESKMREHIKFLKSQLTFTNYQLRILLAK